MGGQNRVSYTIMRMKFNFFHLAAFFFMLLSFSSCREGYTVPFYIGCLEDAEPYSFRDANGEITGLEVDMIQAAADYYGIRVSFIPTSYEDIYNQLQKKHHKIDGAVAMIPWTIQRMEEYTLVTPSYITTSYCMAVSDDADLSSFGDLEGKTLAVKSGSLAYAYALDHESDWGCTIEVYDTFQDEIYSVTSGRTDALFEDRLLIDYYIKKHQTPLHILYEGISNIAYAFVTGKDQDKTLRRDIQEGLEGIIEDGTAQAIIDHYTK